MARARPVDISVDNFLKGTGAVLVLLVGLQAWLLIVQDQGPNVAFTMSIIITLLLIAPILWLMKRRPLDASLSWGEAMVGATYAFLSMFWIYGVVPHQWLVYADSELGWRSDRFVLGPDVGGQGIIERVLPFDLPYEVIRDIVAVVIYGIGLTAMIALFGMWQRRGAVAETTVEKSTFGRPLVREGAREGANA